MMGRFVDLLPSPTNWRKFVKASANRVFLDVCGLSPPEPMERILDALATLGRDRCLCVMINREPFPLYPILERRGFEFDIHPVGDKLYQLDIQAI